MRTSFLAVIGLLASSGLASPANLFERASCNSDNCKNAVSKVTSAKADCSSFMTRTVTPCPVATVTSTTTSTVTSSIGSAASATPSPKRWEPEARAVTSSSAAAATCPTTRTNTAAPSYASACSGTSRYSSACSCLGVSTGVTTAPSPTATSWATATTTTTVTAVYSTFKARATSGRSAGQWLARNVTTGNDVVDRVPVMGFTGDASLAETFVLAAGGSILGMRGQPAYPWVYTGGHSSLREEPGDDNVEPVIRCSLAALSLAGNARINCRTRDGGPGFWQNCPTLSPNALYLGPDVYPGTEGPDDQCFGLDLVTVPVTS